MTEAPPSGPLSGLNVIELAGAGPGPFCGMMLADMGANVIQVERVEPNELGPPTKQKFNFLNRGRRSIALDLKQPEGLAIVKKLIVESDVLIEGFRPGVTERLGIGPDACFAINPKLIYGRTTGWGQEGPLSQQAGHDINYIALIGVLDAIGEADGRPIPPLNLLGDFAGGALYLAFGILCAVYESRKSGKGQVVDSAIIDGAAHLMTPTFGKMASGTWQTERGRNAVAGGAPWYRVYETKDRKYVSVGPIERRFFRDLMSRLGLDPNEPQAHFDQAGWPALAAKLAKVFLTKTRDEWTEILEGTDVCFAPVLTLAEAQQNPHIVSREVFVESEGYVQPAPAPRFSRSKVGIGNMPQVAGQHTSEILLKLGTSEQDIEKLRDARVVL